MGRKGGRGREPVARLQYLTPGQFRELTGRDPDPLPLPETRSQVLVLAPSEGDGWPARFGDPVFVEATQEDLARLRVSAALIERLRAWGEAWIARVDIGADPREAAPGWSAQRAPGAPTAG